MRGLIEFSVKRPVTIIILVSVVLIMGFFTFSRLAVDLYPEMKFPVAAVITSYQGAGPEEVESQVTEPLEGVLTTLGNLETLQSFSSSGQSVVIVSFKWGTDIDNAALDIREKVGMVESYLPDGVEKPTVFKMDPTMMPILQMGIGGKDLAQLQSIAEEVIEPRLSRIPEIASVEITGGLQREVRVEVDPVKLENYGLSLSQVNQVLQMENFNTSAGTVEHGGRKYFVRNLQQFEKIDDIRNVAILSPTGNTIFLRDIAEITDGYKDVNQITKMNGISAVGIHCLKQTDANTINACDAVRQEMEKISQELGIDFEVEYVFDQSLYIKETIDSTKKMMYEGAILAMLVLFLFLRNGRSTVIIFTAIPLSVVATFIIMYFTNYTVNLLTLGGLALGIGRIVDDSIVVFENIYRHRSLGLPPKEAAIAGASEVGNAVVAATLTIIAVFIPMVFVEGLAAILFKPLAMTISFAIFSSLLVALTIVPLMSSRMLTDKSMHKKDQKTGFIYRTANKFGNWIDTLGERYKVLLEKALKQRRRVVVIVTVLMIASLAGIPFIGAEFLPAMDSGEISINIETDKGNLLEETDYITAQVEEKLREIPEVETVFTSIGGTIMMMSGGQDKATLYVKLCPKTERDKSVGDVAEEIRQSISDIAGAKFEVGVMDMASMMGSGGAINVQVRGDDLKVLKEISSEVAEVVRNVPGTREVSNSLTDGSPEFQIKVDRNRAAAYGLTPVQIASEVRNAMQGTVATRYRVEGEEIDVRVRYQQQSTNDLSHLSNLTIFSPTGHLVRLSQVATFEMAQGPVTINRTDQVRIAEINADLLNRDLKSVMDDIKAGVSDISLPAGYTVEYGGANQEMVEAFSSLAIALLLAIILVYAVMAIQYESFFNPFVIMFSVPTAIIGVILGLFITGRTFNVPAFIGLIMLVGIVVSNAIVFVDYLKQLRERGMERDAAIIETGRVRLRPILMTAFSTILAMFPLSLGIGEGAEAQAPLATVIIGGLLVSTLITLVLVPVVYSIFDDWGQKLQKRISPDKMLDSQGRPI
ncbi:MAG: efflux RND transporter permease subunit [Syntrophomonadaceae bacterium]|jgi:HAE1 family hydrophobic/amphiphilic exporter-1